MAYIREQSSNWCGRGVKSYMVVMYIHKRNRKGFAIHAETETDARAAVDEIEATLIAEKEKLLASGENLEEHIMDLEDVLMKEVKKYRLEPKRNRRKN